jgi:hypothetical protein
VEDAVDGVGSEGEDVLVVEEPDERHDCWEKIMVSAVSRKP